MKYLKNTYRILIIFTFAFFTTFAMFSQNPLQGEPSPELKEVAKEAAERWQDELALSDKQRELMENKIIEFTMKKNALINSKMREEAKTEGLRELQRAEYKDMRNILTRPQFDLYVKLSQERMRKQGKDGNPKK